LQVEHERVRTSGDLQQRRIQQWRVRLFAQSLRDTTPEHRVTSEGEPEGHAARAGPQCAALRSMSTRQIVMHVSAYGSEARPPSGRATLHAVAKYGTESTLAARGPSTVG
jgi:hypothetical protein